MASLLGQPFYISEYPEYEPVLQCVLKFFLQEKGEHGINFISKIDEIISHLFRINTTYASKFRKLYFPSARSQSNSKLYDKCINHYKIGHFNFKQMVFTCKQYGIRIPDETYNGILLLSSFALPLSEILKDKSQFEIHSEFKSSAKIWINEIERVMQNSPNLKAALFMYLHQFRENELVWWLLATLPTIDLERVKKWIATFGNISSEKTILEIITPIEKTDFLLDFKNKFSRLNARNLKNIYDNVSGFDLQCAYLHIDYFKQFSRTPLRSEDIFLTYLIVSTLKQFPQELMLEQIASASKANLPIDFCPTNEIQIDWNTQTAW